MVFYLGVPVSPGINLSPGRLSWPRGCSLDLWHRSRALPLHEQDVLLQCGQQLIYNDYDHFLNDLHYIKVRSKEFSRVWSVVQGVQAVPCLVGVSLTG